MNISSSKIFSSPIIKSNLKRYMPLMFFGVLYYIIIYLLPEFLNTTSDTLIMADTRGNNLLGVRFYCAVAPLIVAIPMFGFLHRKNSSIFHHALPFTRMQIFVSTVISGLIVINIPNLLLAIYVAAQVSLEAAFNMFLFAITATLFEFAICSLAGIISGTSVMHILTSVWFNLLVQSIYGVILVFATAFLNGFSVISAGKVILAMSPITCQGWEPVSVANLVYILVAIVIFIVSALLYKKLKLERCENSITFTSVKLILNALAGIYMMTIIGTIVYISYATVSAIIIASLIGAVLGVLIGYMLLNKTFRVFNKKSLKMSAVMVVISMLFLGTFMVDIYGYEDKIPDINDVEYVSFDESLYTMDADMKAYNDGANKFEDRDVISNVIKLQKKIIARGDISVSPNNALTYSGDWAAFQIGYKLKDGSEFHRRYIIPYDETEEVKYIYESKEFKEKMSLKNLKYPIRSIELYGLENEEYKEITDAVDIASFIKNYDLDFQKLTYEEAIKAWNEDHLQAVLNTDEQFIHITISPKDTNTLNFLKEKGYLSK